MLAPSTLQFLKGLKKNNSKTWFDSNRPKYEGAKKDFETFIANVLNAHGKNDPSIAGLEAKKTLFRINRDIRFSKDKSPYKTNFGASFGKSGKGPGTAGYYFHLEPGNKSFVGGGLYIPDPADLKKVRQEIDYNFDQFRKILKDPSFKKIYGDLDRSDEFVLSRVPKGYSPDNPAAEYLRLKSFIAFTEISDEELVSKKLLMVTVNALKAIQPLNEFLNEARS